MKRKVMNEFMKNVLEKVLALFLCAFSASGLSAGEFSLYKVPLDTLVNRMGRCTASPIFAVSDTLSGDVFTLDASRQTFFSAAEDLLLKSGYTITRYDGKLFILKGTGISLTLPDNYFSSGETLADNSAYLKILSEEEEVATFANKVYEIGRIENCKGGSVLLRGTVTDVASDNPVQGVTVSSKESGQYALTDIYGEYQLRLPAGENTLQVMAFSYDDLQIHTIVYENGVLNIPIKEKVYSLTDVVVTSEMTNRRRNEMGVESIRMDRIKRIPSAMGEADVVKSLLTLPGVKSVGESSGGFNVRGGAADQNLILFNDGTIYNSSHLFGLFSAFNSDVVSNVELYKSSIPATYGGRISSVLEVTGKEGNRKKVKGAFGIGLLTTRLYLEGPLSEKTTFVVGGRVTYSDWLLNRLPATSGYRNGSANFYDINASLTHRFDNRNTLYAYGYYSRDRFSFSADTAYHYANLNASLKWRHAIRPSHFMTLSAGYDQYLYDMTDRSNVINAYTYGFGIRDLFAKVGFKLNLDERHILSYGFDGKFYLLQRGNYLPFGEMSLVVPTRLATEQGLEGAFYAGDDWTINELFSVNAGVRLSTYTAMTPQAKFYCHPEIRLSGKYLANDWLSVKAGFNSMTQHIHLLSNSVSISPTDTWKLSDADIKPQTGWQAAAGLYGSVLNNNVEISLEGYYKQFNNYLDYKSGAVLMMKEDLRDEIIRTRGRAYGVEFMVRKLIGKFNGWIAYTYSRTELQDKDNPGTAAVNRGEWYAASFDKPHDFKMVGNYKFTHRLSLSLNVDYSTGRPVTIPISGFTYANGTRLHYSDRNAYRIPDYFRLDGAINIEPGHYLKKLTHFSITLGCYNLTGRKNAYSVFYRSEGDSVKGYMLTVFGSQIPYANININF